MPAKKTRDEFIAHAQQVHSNKFDYSLVDYTSAINKVKIICHKHGEFLQRPHDHTQGKGCPACGNESRAIRTGDSKRSTLEQFITKSKAVHGDRYSYIRAVYKGALDLIEIVCRKHGSFWQAAHSHMRGSGCPTCNMSSSKIEAQWLDSLGISEENRCYYIKINNQRFFVDGYDPSTKTCYELNGDWWHGNPAKYNPSAYHPLLNKSYSELYHKTIARQQLLEAHGYKVISVWESDFKSSLKQC